MKSLLNYINEHRIGTSTKFQHGDIIGMKTFPTRWLILGAEALAIVGSDGKDLTDRDIVMPIKRHFSNFWYVVSTNNEIPEKYK